jgi:hypothetical protein
MLFHPSHLRKATGDRSSGARRCRDSIRRNVQWPISYEVPSARLTDDLSQTSIVDQLNNLTVTAVSSRKHEGCWGVGVEEEDGGEDEGAD